MGRVDDPLHLQQNARLTLDVELIQGSLARPTVELALACTLCEIGSDNYKLRYILGQTGTSHDGRQALRGVFKTRGGRRAEGQPKWNVLYGNFSSKALPPALKAFSSAWTTGQSEAVGAFKEGRVDRGREQWGGCLCIKGRAAARVRRGSRTGGRYRGRSPVAP